MTHFVEQDEPPLKIFSLDRYRDATVVPIHRWRGRLLDAAAFVVSGDEKVTNFDKYTVRTFARKVYFVNQTAVPNGQGRLPSRKTFRHLLEADAAGADATCAVES